MFSCLERTFMAHFGEWLFAARKQAGLSQEEVADLANVSKNYISVLERNLPNYKTGALPQPSRKVVSALAMAVSKSEAEALKAAGYSLEEDRDYAADDDVPRLLAFYNGLNADGKDELVGIAELLWKARNKTTHGRKAE